MTASRSQMARQPLHIQIDPSPWRTANNQHYQPAEPSPDSSSPPYSNRTSLDANGSSSQNSYDTADEWNISSVLCLHDFYTDDPDQLSFSKNEILSIVKKEPSGWWAAVRDGGTVVGWIPSAFVVELDEAEAEHLRSVTDELRIYEYDAERIWTAAAARSAGPPLYDSEPELTSPSGSHTDGIRGWIRRTSTRRTSTTVNSSLHVETPSTYVQPQSAKSQYCPYPPPSPLTPVPQPPPHMFGVDKPTPPTPKDPGVPGEISPTRNRERRQAVRVDDLVRRAPSLSSVPWFLRPRYFDQLEVDNEGHLRFGTLAALVERLACNALSKEGVKMADDAVFPNVFLMTFRTFTTADTLFNMLVERYRFDDPQNVSDAEYEEWKEKRQIPTRQRVLVIFTMWLEDHRLLQEEPHIAQRLTNFLQSIVAPLPLATTAKLILQSIERLTFSGPSQILTPTAKRRRKSRAHKNDLLKLDPADIAEQLSILEFKHYSKISPQECIEYVSTQGKGNNIPNLSAFCSTHDKLAGWVKTSILVPDGLGRRAETIEFWIKVAEKCRNLHNYASMSSIVNGLSTVVIVRLQLTWAHVGQRSKTTLENLTKHGEPAGGFAGYRALYSSVDSNSPCVPFIGMYLTDMTHIRDHHEDEGERINWTRRQKWHDVISTMLKYQKRPYNIAESDSTTTYISTNLHLGSLKDQNWFWDRFQAVLNNEVAHADIRKGLEAAGF
ncbi:hypothetical protein AX16_000454 [Volvariella volvacea WC 439]|nr:hypothetical protein AX16_000454 [Volvariella volvacea WC 439]